MPNLMSHNCLNIKAVGTSIGSESDVGIRGIEQDVGINESSLRRRRNGHGKGEGPKELRLAGLERNDIDTIVPAGLDIGSSLVAKRDCGCRQVFPGLKRLLDCNELTVVAERRQATGMDAVGHRERLPLRLRTEAYEGLERNWAGCDYPEAESHLDRGAKPKPLS